MDLQKLDNFKEGLIKSINAYKKAGNNFHVARSRLPFYKKLSYYALRHYQVTGIKRTTEQTMKELGFKDYSDSYFRALSIKDIDKFCDENGYFRPDDNMRTRTKNFANAIGLPYPVAVMLLCDKKMDKFYLEADFISMVKKQALNYIGTYGSLRNVSSIDKKLYSRIDFIKKQYASDGEKALATLDVLEILGLDGVDNNLKGKPTKIDIDAEMQPLQELAQTKNGRLLWTDIDTAAYNRIYRYTCRAGISMKDHMESYGIDYQAPRTIKNRMGRVMVLEYPFMKQMKARLADLMQEGGISLANGNCIEEVFEARLACSKQVFAEFEDRISDYMQSTLFGETESDGQ